MDATSSIPRSWRKPDSPTRAWGVRFLPARTASPSSLTSSAKALETPPVFHLAYYGYEKTVIDSQVVTPARRLASEGRSPHLVFLEGFRTFLSGGWHPRQQELTRAGIPSTFLPRVPRNFLGANTERLSRFLAPHLAAGPVVVHARGLQAAHSVLPIRMANPNLRLICDVRGMEAAEYELDIETSKGRALNGIERRWRDTLSEIEREAVAGSDHVLCVSRSMPGLLARRAGVPESKFSYLPCAVEVSSFSAGMVERDRVRRELGLVGKVVFLYAGSLSAWQVPEKVMAVVRAAIERIPDVAFLGLTPDPETLAAYATRAGIPADRIVCRRVAHADMAAYLAAGDIGLLLRDANEVNQYACPTKFAEYLSAGLHVVATDAVDEVAMTLRETGAGTLLSGTAPGEVLDRELGAAVAAAADGNRVARSLSAAQAYDWSRHLPTLKKWYFETEFESPK